MERLKNAIASICPHLQIKVQAAEVLSSEEIVFIFNSYENIRPLHEMLRKYELKSEIDLVDDKQFLFIIF